MEDQVPEASGRSGLTGFKGSTGYLGRGVWTDAGTVQEVLVEEVNDHAPGLMTGRLSNNTVVHFPGDASMIGRLVPVYLQESKGFLLYGTYS